MISAEANKIEIDISFICRTCLSSCNTSRIQESEKKYFHNIFESLSIPVKELNIDLVICENCVLRLKQFSGFREMCLESHSIIKSILCESTFVDTDATAPIEISHKTQEQEYACKNISQNNKSIKVCESLPILEEISEDIERENESIVCDQHLRNEDLANHMVSNDIKDYKCSKCQEGFISPTLLMKHVKMHIKKGVTAKYGCNRCDKVYTSVLNLKIHMYSHNGIKPYSCTFCNRGFTKKSTLAAHLTLHTGKRNFLCNDCGKGFTSLVLLNRHQLVHTGDKPFKCELCKGGFISMTDLNIHKRCHTGEKPYLCPTCGKSFCRSSNLKIHRRIHTGERPYVCITCSQAFGQSGDLRAHKRIHTGEKPYTCNVCNKRFRQSGGLSKHMKTHSGELYYCELCIKKFPSPTSLAKHRLSHQKD